MSLPVARACVGRGACRPRSECADVLDRVRVQAINKASPFLAWDPLHNDQDCCTGPLPRRRPPGSHNRPR